MLEVLKTLPENSIDTCITDPPYHLTSIVKRFGKENSAPAKFGTDGVFSRTSSGFLGQKWDGGDIAFRPETWYEVYRVLKPGAYLLVFGSTRTFHRMVCAVEDAGFIPVETIVWAHGQGFPKALNVSKAIDRRLGVDRDNEDTPEAQLFDGWRTALKPAIELITVAMKPLYKSYVDNALTYGVAGFNIEEARIPAESVPINKLEQWSGFGQLQQPDYEQEVNSKGRYPSNLIIDDSEEVRALFPDSKSPGGKTVRKERSSDTVFSNNSCGFKSENLTDCGYDDSGSAARFFYVSKPSKSERNEAFQDSDIKNTHPTLKAIELMRHLVTLTKTPTGGVVLDPFMGSGTTGVACILENRPFIGIEMSPEYFEIAKRRIEYYEKLPKQPRLF